MEIKKFEALCKYDFNVDKKTIIKADSMQNYHYHDSYEIYYLCEGERYYFINDKCFRVKKGSLVFINEYDIHYTTAMSDAGYERFLINFKKEFLKGTENSEDMDLLACFGKGVHIIEFNLKQQQYIEALFEKMTEEFYNKAEGYMMYLKSSLTQLLIMINRYGRLGDESQGYMNSTHKTIAEITGYINNNFFEDISLKSISEKFFISPYYFSRTFKKVSGLSFIDYLNSVRIKEAQKLLIRTDKNITQISEDVGYKSTTHFDRIFKKIIGMSPLAYKKKNK